MHRKLLSGIVAIALFAVAPQALFAQGFLLGPEIAWNDDFDFGIGAGAEVDLDGVANGFGVQGDFLYFFPGDEGSLNVDYWEFNGNATYDFPLKNSTVVPYVLAGINVGNVSLDYEGTDGGLDIFDGDGTEVGLNVGGGIQFDLGSFRPRVGARFVLGGWETFTLYGFLPFRIGG